MNNFVLRLLSSLVLAPIFIFLLYSNNFLFYLLLIFIIILTFYEIYNNVKQNLLAIFLYFLLIFFSYSLLKVRGSDFNNFIDICWIISIVWLSDIGGFVVGKCVGGRKLSKYSPNKTISGFFGSILFSQFALVVPFFFYNNLILNFLHLLLQFIICLLVVFGDIFFSYVKRINNIKDYSMFIPGHGGVLDRIDGMIFAVIFYYIFKNFL
jgi:phosphatidate cytidylyltransferase